MAFPTFHPRSERTPPLGWSIAEFAAAFPGENDHVEFKQGVPARGIAEAMVAFSNASGGVIFLGVADDGTIVGGIGTGEHTASVHKAAATIRNVGRYGIHETTVDGLLVLAIGVSARTGGVAQLPDGRVLVRRGAMNAPLLDPDLSALVRSRQLERFETEPVQAHLSDVDQVALGIVAEAWGWIVDSDIGTRLSEKGLASEHGANPQLTVAGALLLLADPSAVLGKALVEVFRYRDEGDAYDRRLEFGGPAHVQIREAVTAVQGELGTELVVLGATRHELPRLPEVVVREAIANAVAHRVYEHSA